MTVRGLDGFGNDLDEIGISENRRAWALPDFVLTFQGKYLKKQKDL
jgi:hypothetical protein